MIRALFKKPSHGLIVLALFLHAFSTFPTGMGLTLFGIAAGATILALVLSKRDW